MVLALSLGVIASCHAHECEWRAMRCHEGEMQECYCKTSGGMIAANTCTEPARWRAVRNSAGCIDTPRGPRGSRETCPSLGMDDFCEERRAVSCTDAENGAALLFASPCNDGETCRVDEDDVARCAFAPEAPPETALLLYTTHPVELGDVSLWAPARLPYDAELSTDRDAFVVVLLGDRVRAYRGSNVPIARQGARVTRPRAAFAELLRDGRHDERTIGALVADAELALVEQTFYSRPLPHLREITRASALWHAGKRSAALEAIDTALAAEPGDEALDAARARLEAGAPTPEG